ncbi:MAG: type II toxin-antitoxin system MqsA family antitoxin [Acidiferrobacter sp.]
MKCALCNNGDTHPGHAHVTLSRADTVVVIKGMPADVCKNCGEYYLSEAVTENILAQASTAVERGTE